MAVVGQSALGVALLAWLTARAEVTLGDVWGRLANVSVGWLLAGGGLFGLSIGLTALRMRLFLPASVGVIYLLSVVLMQHALLTFLPWRLGEVALPMLLRGDRRVSLVDSAAMIGLIRITDLVVVLCAAVLAGGQLFPLEGLDPAVVGAGLGGAILAGGVLVLVVRRSGALPLIWRMVPSWVASHGRGRALVVFGLLSAGIFGVNSGLAMCMLGAVDVSISAIQSVTLTAWTLLVAVVPVHPPGGVGTVDAFQVVVMERLGFPPHVATPAILSAHALHGSLILVAGLGGVMLRRGVREGGVG